MSLPDDGAFRRAASSRRTTPARPSACSSAAPAMSPTTPARATSRPPGCPVYSVWFVLTLTRLRQLLQVFVAACSDDLRVLGVDVRDAAMQQRHRERLALVVEDRDLAGVLLRVPEDVVAVLERGRRLLDLVGAPGDAGRVDRVRHRVARAHVVERALQRLPDVLQVRQVRVVDRLDQLARHCARQVLDGREPDVERRLPEVSLASASSSFSKVVTLTLTPNSFWNALTTPG